MWLLLLNVPAGVTLEVRIRRARCWGRRRRLRWFSQHGTSARGGRIPSRAIQGGPWFPPDPDDDPLLEQMEADEATDTVTMPLAVGATNGIFSTC